MSPRRTTSAAGAGSSRTARARTARARTGASPRTGASVVPTLRTERRLLRESGHQLLAAVDEVGRGAFAGPVSVGVVVVDLDLGTAPQGLRDSKLLTPEARQRLAPRVRRWARAWAVGHASSAEIDELGILRALRLAGERAMADLPVRPTLVLLDGSYDWLTRPEGPPTLFDLTPADSVAVPAPRGGAPVPCPPDPLSVTTMVKADLRCAGVAAASVLAKTARDALMVDLDRSHPEYGWAANKGYASPDHLEALRTLGPCALHRRSWNLRVLALREAGLLDGAGEPGEPLPEELCLPEDELDAEELTADELGADELGADELGAEELGADELGRDELDPDDDDLLPEGMLDTQPRGLPARIG